MHGLFVRRVIGGGLYGGCVSVVRRLQQAPVQRRVRVGRVGRRRGWNFGEQTRAAVQALQGRAGLAADGVVGDRTWAVSLHAASATLESGVGLSFISG